MSSGIEILRSATTAYGSAPTRPQTELHNELAGEVVRLMTKATFASGGGPTDLMVLLESVVTGCFLVSVKLGGDDKVLDALVRGVRLRTAAHQILGTQRGEESS